MTTPTILVATWDNGLFSVTGNTVHQELSDQPVRSLVADGQGGVLAIVGTDAKYLAVYLPLTFVFEEVAFRGALDAHVHHPGDRRGWQSALRTGTPLTGKPCRSRAPGR